MARTKAAAEAVTEERPPLYDPAVHTDPAQLVFTELFCLCGGIWRQRDPVEVVEPFVRSWLAQHVGEGHGPASKKQAVDEREARKEAALRAVGRGAEYRRKTYERLDDTDTTVLPWPTFPEEG